MLYSRALIFQLSSGVPNLNFEHSIYFLHVFAKWLLPERRPSHDYKQTKTMKKTSSKKVSRSKKDASVNDINPTPNSGALTTNVQVCARIRPIPSRSVSKERETIAKSSSTKKERNSSPGRKPSTKKKSKGRTSTTSKKSTSQKPDNDCTLVAWDISDDKTTALQSNKTEIAQGRTHSFTLDNSNKI